jgi:predicted dehydrogenase
VSNRISTPVRLGLIGAGRWGQNYIKMIRALSVTRLAALASRNPASKNLVDSACHITLDWRELLDAKLVDGVIIATPPDVHAEMLESAMRAGIPAMIEKPLTLNLQDALKLQALQRELQALVLVDHTQLFNSGYIELKRQAKQLGSVRTIHSEAGKWGPFRDYTALWDYAPHDLSITLDLMRQAPVDVRITELESRPVEGGLGANYRIELDFGSGARADIMVGNLLRERIRRFTVDFNQQSLVLDDLATDKLVLHNHASDTRTAVTIDSKLPLTRAVETFVDGIRGRATEHFGLGLAVEIARVLAHGPARL